MGLLGSIFGAIAGSFLGPVGSLIGAAAGNAGESLLRGKPKGPLIAPQPTRDDARKQMQDQDALLRRRGAAADILTGTSGAEAPAGATGRLIVGS